MITETELAAQITTDFGSRGGPSVETKGIPLDFLKELIDNEWNHSEANGGKTFMGDVISGVTRALVDTQNKVLYGKDDEQK